MIRICKLTAFLKIASESCIARIIALKNKHRLYKRKQNHSSSSNFNWWRGSLLSGLANYGPTKVMSIKEIEGG